MIMFFTFISVGIMGRFQLRVLYPLFKIESNNINSV